MTADVRPAEGRDVPSLAALYLEFHNYHAARVPRRLRKVNGDDCELSAEIRRLIASEQAAVLVAIVDGQVVGLAEVHLRESDPQPAVVARRYGHLQAVAVTESMRGHGIGTRLVAAAHRWASSHGASEMQVDTWEFAGGPLPFYEGLGYQTERRTLVADL